LSTIYLTLNSNVPKRQKAYSRATPMNSLEAQLDYCLGTTVPEPGRAVDIAPGIRWVRMSLPFALNHINLWLLRDRIEGEGGAPAKDGWSIVDCGIDNAATRAAWEQVFAT